MRAEADRCDAAPRAGRGPLHGIGIGVKDIIATADQPTQMGSPIYAGHRPEDDAECVARLKRAGGYVFGKAVTTAFAFLDPSKTKNPWNPRHTPGGSSAGPAAAVAAGHVAGAIGTQTNGSVIRPAAYCGVVGFKPTKDAIPFAGVHLFSETLDQLGTFTRTVADAARLASALADAGAHRAGARGDGEAAALRLSRRLSVDAGRRLRRRRHARRGGDARCGSTAPRSSPVGLPAPWREAHLVHRTIMLFEAATHLAALQDRERARLSPKLNAALDEGRAIARADYEAALARAKPRSRSSPTGSRTTTRSSRRRRPARRRRASARPAIRRAARCGR